ncbi:MAG: hypothetical protein ABI663_07685 [Chryseolinea sp.]
MKTIKIVRQHLAFVSLFLLVSCSTSEEKIIDAGQPIHHDDFEYVIENFSVQKKIDGNKDTLTAHGNYYVVSFKVVNNAKRVSHPWKNSIAFLIDEAGNKYENITEAQIALNSSTPFGYKDEYLTSSQSEETTVLVFDIPESVKKPYLMVRGEMLMGDFFDGNQFSNTKVKLF